MKYRPPKKTLLLWQLRVAVAFVVFAAIISWLWFLTTYSTYIVIAAAIVAVAVVFAYLPQYIKRYDITLSENALIIKSGVFITHERIMPYPRLLYTERLRTPLAARFGVSALVLKATRTAAVMLELNDADIEEITGAISK